MTKLKVLSAGLLAATLLTTPVMAQYYPNSRYLRGGYGGPVYYPPGPPVGAFATAPWDDGYAYYYGGPVTVPPGPPVGAFATAPWGSGYTYYYGGPVIVPPGPPVGAFATAPWDNGYAYYYGE